MRASAYLKETEHLRPKAKIKTRGTPRESEQIEDQTTDEERDPQDHSAKIQLHKDHLEVSSSHSLTTQWNDLNGLSDDASRPEA